VKDAGARAALSAIDARIAHLVEEQKRLQLELDEQVSRLDEAIESRPPPRFVLSMEGRTPSDEEIATRRAEIAAFLGVADDAVLVLVGSEQLRELS